MHFLFAQKANLRRFHRIRAIQQTTGDYRRQFSPSKRQNQHPVLTLVDKTHSEKYN